MLTAYHTEPVPQEKVLPCIHCAATNLECHHQLFRVNVRCRNCFNAGAYRWTKRGAIKRWNWWQRKQAAHTPLLTQLPKVIRQIEAGTLEWSESLRELAKRAVESMKSREDEDIDEWAERLADNVKDLND